MQHMAIGDDGKGDKHSSDNHEKTTSSSSTSLADCFQDRVEIAYGSKVGHILRLHKKTGIPLSEMAFFDNESGNIRAVSKGLPAVKCYYTPDGMTAQAWEKAKADFGMER